MEHLRHNHEYDLPTAVTFLVAGLGIGAILTLLFSSRVDHKLHEAQHTAEQFPTRKPA
jgi:hypothetical protein